MSFIQDFKKFLFEKDIITVAVAFIIAIALKVVIKSIVDDVIMPIAGLILGGVDFSKQFISLSGTQYATLEAAREAEAAVITYGNLIQALINFLIIGLVAFFLVKAYDKVKKKKEEAAPAGPSKEEILLTEIRDELKKRNV